MKVTDGRVLGGMSSREDRPEWGTGCPFLPRTESALDLPRGDVASHKGQERNLQALARLWNSRNLGSGPDCQCQGQGEETQLCLCPNWRVGSQSAQGLRTSKAEK